MNKEIQPKITLFVTKPISTQRLWTSAVLVVITILNTISQAFSKVYLILIVLKMALFLFAFLEDLVPFLNVWWLGNSRTAGVQVQITCTYSNICFGIKYNCMKKMSKTGFLKNIQMQIYLLYIQIFAYLMYFFRYQNLIFELSNMRVYITFPTLQ